jgi:hypothetical protein
MSPPSGDVAKTVARAVSEPGHESKTYELGGPAVLSFREVMELILKEIERKRVLLPLPFPIARMIGVLSSPLAVFTPWAPPLTTDQVESLKTDNVVSGAYPGLADLGIEPTTVEAILPTYLYRFRKGGQFADLTESVPV